MKSASFRRFRVAPALPILGAAVFAVCAVTSSSARDDVRCDAHAPRSARSLACAEALRLLSQLPLPPGSHRLSGRPSFASELKGPSTKPLAKTLLDRDAFWSIPLAPAQAVHWIGTHLPAGWRESLRGDNVGANGVECWEERFSLTSTTFAEVGVGLVVVADPSGGSVVRVDAQVLWFPPRPRSSLVPLDANTVTLLFAPVRSAPSLGMQPGRAVRPPLRVADPVEVRALVRAVNELHLPTGGPVLCEAEPVNPVYVWLIFRASSTRRPVALVRASPIVCSGGGFVSLTVRGRPQPLLDESDRLLQGIHAILGVRIPNLSPGGLENMRHARDRRARIRTHAPPPNRPGWPVASTRLSTGTPGVLSESQLIVTALREAKRNGDSRPSFVEHVESFRHHAVLVESRGDVVPGNEPVYVIEVRGRFRANTSVPHGAIEPHGSVLTLVVGAETARVLDWGVSNRSTPLARLGRVVVDLGGSPNAPGTLVGGIRFVGGPPLPTRAHFPRARAPFSAGWVHVYDWWGKTVALVHVARGHRFHISLPAGAYPVLASQTRGSRSSLGCMSNTVLISAHRSSHALLLLGCAVP